MRMNSLEDYDNNTSPRYFNIYTRIPSIRFYWTVIISPKTRGKQIPSKSQVSVGLDTSRIKKMILLNDFEYPKDSAVVTTYSML